MLVEQEIENKVHSVAFDPEIVIDLIHGNVGLGEQHRFRLPPGEKIPQICEIALRRFGRTVLVWHPSVFDEKRYGINSET
jgi:hypothetical protein